LNRKLSKLVWHQPRPVKAGKGNLWKTWPDSTGSRIFHLIGHVTGKSTECPWNLGRKDIDFEKGAVNVSPEKNSNARQLKVSNRLIAMLNSLPHNYLMVFRNPEVDPIESIEHFRRNFIKRRERLAQNLQNPRINAITFHTLRHFKATMEYRRTKDILFVQKILG
jgi:integrase